MKPKTLILMVVAIVCGLGASYMTSRLLAERGSEEETAKVSVLVAKKHLDMGTHLKTPAELFEQKVFIRGQEPKTGLSSLDAVKGKFLRRSLRKGDFIAGEDLADEFSQLPIPPGMRAVGIRVNNDSSAAGWASLPGSRVDIVSTIRRTGDDDGAYSEILLQNVLVLAADGNRGRDGEASGAMPANVVTVALDPKDALKVDLASQMGSLRLILRNPADETNSDATRVTSASLIRGKGYKPKESAANGGFEPPPVGDGPSVPVVVAPKQKDEPPPLVEAPVVPTHTVVVTEGDNTRKVVFQLGKNGEVNKDDVQRAPEPRVRELPPAAVAPAPAPKDNETPAPPAPAPAQKNAKGAKGKL
jgi:pilus assembly protein CpaB